ncbi:hypothetical protein BDZ91DRAFT_499435 [Kalaharituber pfeilii]|nr:hypothetical protein BDZ91DRAFT_499435 [Kalaharituber pfeilii]
MLQSPGRRAQRQQRLNTASENPLLEAKQQQQHALTAASTAHKHTLERQQHRRQLSAPDESLLLKSGMAAKGMSFDGEGGEALHNVSIMNCAFNIFTVTEQPSVSNQARQGYPPMPSQPYYQFPRAQQHQHVRKGSVDSMQHKRRGSLLNPASHMRPLAPTGRIDETNMLSQDMFGHGDHPIPTRAHTTPMMSVSAFDMAPLPHPHFVNLSSLAMGSPGSDLDESSFYSHSPLSMSPGFPPHDVQQQLAVFDTSLQSEITSSPVLPAQNPCHARPLLAPAPVPNETVPIERPDMGGTNSGITMEEIASFIAGPEASDGKWVCLYEGCAKRFGRKENIKSHVQTHLGDRQFKCQVCKKCFVRQHDLKRHSKIHTGVKPYPCLCGNSFARHDALTRHRQRGMCIGAFEGVVRKEVKRGRPRKKPLPKEEASSGSSSSGASDTSSSDTTGREELASAPPTPTPEVESPGGLPEISSGDDYTPPTSPGYDAEGFAAAEKTGFEGFADVQYITAEDVDFTGTSNTTPKKGSSAFNNPGDFGASVDMTLFTDDMMGLTALERDPTILNFDDGFIKTELLDPAETAFYQV